MAVKESDDEDTAKLLSEIIEGMTGIEPLLDYTMEECGLASVGVPILVNLRRTQASCSITLDHTVEHQIMTVA